MYIVKAMLNLDCTKLNKLKWKTWIWSDNWSRWVSLRCSCLWSEECSLMVAALLPSWVRASYNSSCNLRCSEATWELVVGGGVATASAEAAACCCCCCCCCCCRRRLAAERNVGKMWEYVSNCEGITFWYGLIIHVVYRKSK